MSIIPIWTINFLIKLLEIGFSFTIFMTYNNGVVYKTMEKTMKYEKIENKIVVDHFTNSEIRVMKISLATENDENKIKLELKFLKQQYKIAKQNGIAKQYDSDDSYYINKKSFATLIEMYERELELRKNGKRLSNIKWPNYKNSIKNWDKKKIQSFKNTLNNLISQCENAGWAYIETEMFRKNPKKYDAKCVNKCDLVKMLKLIGG